jgi:hypothetical protein
MNGLASIRVVADAIVCIVHQGITVPPIQQAPLNFLVSLVDMVELVKQHQLAVVLVRHPIIVRLDQAGKQIDPSFTCIH